MSVWLAQWSPSIIAIFLVLVSATGIISALVGRVKDFIFGRVVGSFVEAATAKTSERDHAIREKERQAILREEQNRRVADAVDKLAEALNGYVDSLMAGDRGLPRGPYVQSAHLAISQLERYGPQESLQRLFEINDHLAAENSERRTRVYSERINRTWVNAWITSLNKAVRNLTEKQEG